MIVAHLLGGPVDGTELTLEKAPPCLKMPRIEVNSEGWAVRYEQYNRRFEHLHPASFVLATGGPCAGQWLFDHEGNRSPERIGASMEVASEIMMGDGLKVVSASLLDAMTRVAEERGLTVRLADVEWTVHPINTVTEDFIHTVTARAVAQ